MNVGQFLEKFGRTMLERPLATSPDPDEPPELAEIRLAILDQVREKSYRSGGRKVFPYDLLRVELRGVEQSRAPCSPASSSASTWSRKSTTRCAPAAAGIPIICGWTWRRRWGCRAATSRG
jgi:hypothetical protein